MTWLPAHHRAAAHWLCSVPLFLLVAASRAVSGQGVPDLVDNGRAALDSQVEMRTFRVASKSLAETRRVRVVLPPSFDRTAADRRYPVVVVFDGESLTRVVQAASAELVRNGQIPEAVIVGIDNFGPSGALNGGMKRVFDLTPPGLSVSGSDLKQGGDLMLDFVERELLPAIDRQFRTAEPRIIVGHSSGAILATYAVATRDAFRAAVSLDAPVTLQNGWLADRLVLRAGAGGRPVRYAAYDARFGWPDDKWSALTSRAPATWRVQRQVLTSEGHETMPLLGAYLGLRDLFGDYSRLAAPSASADSVLRYYGAVDRSLGAAVVPPRRILEQAFDRALNDNALESARAVLAAIVTGYGRSEDAATMESRLAQAAREPQPTETVEGLLGTPFPTPDEARRFVGDWIGDIWMGSDEPRGNAIRLRIRIEAGKVIGETIRQSPQGESVARRWEYLKITPTGMTWGALNGMEPRGVALFEGTLRGDELTGKMRLAGLRPGTDVGPPLQFAFTRARQ